MAKVRQDYGQDKTRLENTSQHKTKQDYSQCNMRLWPRKAKIRLMANTRLDKKRLKPIQDKTT